MFVVTEVDAAAIRAIFRESVGCYLNNAKSERPVNMRALVMPPSFLG